MSAASETEHPLTLLDVVDARARDHSDKVAYTFLANGETETDRLTFGDLRRRALAVAARLRWLNARNARALLIYPQGLEFIVAFFGCLYAGVVAVPVSLPHRKRGLESLRRIATDAGASFILSSGEMLEQVSRELDLSAHPVEISFVDSEACANAAIEPETTPIAATDVALLQYTSGSTGSPRGVVVTHANLVDNQRQIARSFRHDASTVAVSWLPMFHDMGLGTVVGAAWVGAHCLIMSPQAFLQNPLRWLNAISRYRATSSGGPDFAYDLCARRIAREQRGSLDLSSWRVAYNGSEPVRSATLERFAEAFAGCGFKPQAFHPVYGLAEATLLVTSVASQGPPTVQRFAPSSLELGATPAAAPTGQALVGCGSQGEGSEVRIVDPETLQERGQDHVGEIWIRGASVAAGYWGRASETRETFDCTTSSGEGPFLRSGDLGFLHGDQLFVTGRLKDLIIVRGRNHYPHDIEDSVSTCHPSLVPHACAAFSVETEQGEELVIVQEVSRTALRTLDAVTLFRAIRGAVSQHHALHTHAVVLLKPSTLPRTTSGKVRRKLCRSAFLDNSLPAVASWLSPLAPAPDAEAGPDSGKRELSARADHLIDWLRRHAADLINAHTIDERLANPLALLRALAKQGLLGLQVQPQYGGLGLPHAEALRVLEQLAAIDFALALHVGVNNSLGIQPIARYGSPRLKALLLPGLAHGQELAAFALEEPGGRTKPGGVGVQAQSEGEDTWRLFGAKYLDGVTPGASVINVFARHDEPPGISAFVISSGLEGVRQVRDGLSMGLLGFARDTMALDGARVSRDNLLGSMGSGLEIASEAMSQTRLAIAAACVGGMKRCAQLVGRDGPYYDAANGKLTPNPITLARLGSITASISALECLVHRIAQALDAGYAVPSEAFATCKIQGPELLVRCVDDLMQSGVSGVYAETNRLSCLHRDAGLLRNLGGPPEALAELTGAMVMEGDSSLRRLVDEVLHAPKVAPRIELALQAVRRRMTTLHGPLARHAQRWGHTRAGELTAWIVLLAAVEGSRGQMPGQELERARAWAEAQLEHALSAVRFGTPSEMATLSSSDVEATFATYARSIGEWAPTEQLEASAIQSARAPGAAPLVAGGDSQRELRAFIVSWLARRLQIAVSQVEAGRSFADHGLDSVATVELAKALSDKLGRELDETLLWSVSTIDALVAYLVRPVEPSEPDPQIGTARASAQADSNDASLAEEVERLERELRFRS